MNTELLTFAMKTENAHIAIVEIDRIRRDTQFITAQRQLYSKIESVHVLDKRIKLVNGTFIHFCDASRFERLRGLRLDRIETSPAAICMMPEWFLESRLKPGIAPDEGICYHTPEASDTIIEP